MDSTSSSGGKNDTEYDYDVEPGHGQGHGHGVAEAGAGVVDKGKRRAQPSSHLQEDDRVASEATPLLSPSSARGQESYSRLSHPTRRRPNLPSSSTTAYVASGIPTSPSPSASASHNRNTLYRTLIRVFITTLCITVLFFLFILVVGWSYASRIANMEPEDMIEEGVVVRGPEEIEVVNVTSKGVWVDVSGRVGVDAARIAGVQRAVGDEDGVLKSVWKAVGRWGVRKVGSVGVKMEGVEVWSVFGGDDDDEGGSREEMLLLKVVIPPLVVPLSADAPPRRIKGDLGSKEEDDWLTPFSARVFVQPAVDTKHLLKFVRQSWKTGYVGLKTRVKVTKVRLGGSMPGGAGGMDTERSTDSSWLSKLLEKTLKDVKVGIRLRLPSIPGFPHPGHNLPFPSLSQFLTLTLFSARSDDVRGLVLDATATVINPASPEFKFTAPSLPFVVSIPNPPPNLSLSHLEPPSNPESYPLASVHTSPLSLSTHPNITVVISGTLLPLPAPVLPLLSTFISRYLSSKPNPILISPTFLPSSLSSLQIPADFPAPEKPPKVLRDVSIRDMRIRPGGVGDKAQWLASGVVVARIVLPVGVDVKLDVASVFPDVIIFDGEVPDEVDVEGLRRVEGVVARTKRRGRHDDDEDEDGIPPPPEMPLPDPLPERAFGHLRPDGWVDAVSEREDPNAAEEVVYAVSAKVVDVPLEVLPGRQKEFRSFVSKVIFGSEGATAGLLGEAAVLVSVHGLPIVSRPSPSPPSNRTRHGDRKDTEVMLQGLPFRGSVHVGKKSMFGGAGGVGKGDEGREKERDWWDKLREEMERWGVVVGHYDDL